MKVKVSSINEFRDSMIVVKDPRYSADVTLKETVLGQEKKYKETLVLPNVLNMKIAAVFKEIEEYIDNSREGGRLHVKLKTCEDESTIGCHIYYGNDKIITVKVKKDLYKNKKQSLAYSIVDHIGHLFGWKNDSKQKLVLCVKKDTLEQEVITILRAYSNIQVVEGDTPEEE
ncbi:hypothetical protein [Bacillus sp. BB56-3]|uniref:hypothetical protein n=1 Tax=Bacillus sp. BB56-3 TaxID=2217831 RepID=UPI0011ECF914|nr:hypothetical protein [Bacillus sp. BB56-3]KAA0784308.1 hypothetical protein DN406_27225 [Bacillus sp. BB56-3]